MVSHATGYLYKCYLLYTSYKLFNQFSGHSSQITELISSGIRDKMWPRGWVPQGIKNWQSYLQDRVKYILKSKRQEQIKKDMEERLKAKLAAEK